MSTLKTELRQFRFVHSLCGHFMCKTHITFLSVHGLRPCLRLILCGDRTATDRSTHAPLLELLAMT